MVERFRRLYGAGPAHFVLLTSALAFALYLASLILDAPQSVRILIWFAGAAVAHDLILWPLYAVADRILALLHRSARRPSAKVPWVNHVRVPAVFSAVTLVVSFPLVLRRSAAAYQRASGLGEAVYRERWLWLSAGAFALSAAVYALRWGKAAIDQRR